MVQNNGETAYSANIHVTLPDNTRLTKIPRTCEQDITEQSNKMVYICSLTSKAPLFQGNSIMFSINIDTSNLTVVQTIQVEAKVSSYINQLGLPLFDNTIVDNIPMTHFSNIEIFG